jgi:hypothetical protein
MNTMRQILIILALCFLVSVVSAQNKSFKLKATSYALQATNEIKPMWIHANEWGVFDLYEKTDALIHLQGDYLIVDNKNFKLEGGLGGVLGTGSDNAFLHEAYLKGKAWFVDFSIGKEAFSPVVYNDRLSSGLFLMNSNARPVPRVNMGIYNYLPIGFTNAWIAIKGGISQGYLDDDRGNKWNSTENLLLHEKFAYIRFGNKAFKPYAGLLHSALFGGKRPNGTKIKVDFWPTFKGSGSSKLGGGEETNAAGAHMGLWDFGFNWQTNMGNVHFYWQKPFADGSGMRLNNGKNKDHIIGVLIKPKEISWLTGFSMELIKTDEQSGAGLPDPLYPADSDKEGIIWLNEIDDYDAFMMDTFGEETNGWGKEDLITYLEDNYNEGNHYGGRDDFMNNGTYYAGWTYHGAMMGTPLFHTATTVRKYADPWNETDQVYIYNNRVKGFHVGAEGHLASQLAYRLKVTYTENKGTYGEQYHGRYSWDEKENYFFKESKTQLYTMTEINWKVKKIAGLQLNLMFAYDFGDLYHSFGTRLGVSYSPTF